jgi:hypothetical protein
MAGFDRKQPVDPVPFVSSEVEIRVAWRERSAYLDFARHERK